MGRRKTYDGPVLALGNGAGKDLDMENTGKHSVMDTSDQSFQFHKDSADLLARKAKARGETGHFHVIKQANIFSKEERYCVVSRHRLFNLFPNITADDPRILYSTSPLTGNPLAGNALNQSVGDTEK